MSAASWRASSSSRCFCRADSVNFVAVGSGCFAVSFPFSDSTPPRGARYVLDLDLRRIVKCLCHEELRSVSDLQPIYVCFPNPSMPTPCPGRSRLMQRGGKVFSHPRGVFNACRKQPNLIHLSGICFAFRSTFGCIYGPIMALWTTDSSSRLAYDRHLGGLGSSAHQSHIDTNLESAVRSRRW